MIQKLSKAKMRDGHSLFINNYMTIKREIKINVNVIFNVGSHYLLLWFIVQKTSKKPKHCMMITSHLASWLFTKHGAVEIKTSESNLALCLQQMHAN